MPANAGCDAGPQAGRGLPLVEPENGGGEMMGRSAKNLAVVSDAADLFVYPIPATERLESHSFVAFKFRRWRRSEFRGLADLEVKCIGLELFFAAQDESPVGTLPVSPRLLARAVGVSAEVWEDLCNRPVSPLYHWDQCVCDNGEVRLYHPVVLEVAQEALGRRADHLEKRETDKERHRLKNLPAQIIRAGGTKHMADDEAYVIRLDQFLLEHYGTKQRRPNVVREAMERMEIAFRGQI